MKITMKKAFSVVMALVMCVSVLFGMNLSVFAADTNTVNYVYSGDYVYNWGTRETEATFLSPMAEAFYAKKDVALSGLLALNGSSDLNSVSSSTLYNKLYNVMATTNYTSYDATRDLFKYTDCQNSGSPSTISSFYSGKAIGPEWDSGNTWNREHVWPNSKSNGGSNSNTRRETDIMMLRPTSKDENGERSNTAYGESSNFYNPNSESNGAYDLRGDVARIALYVYVRWGGDSNYADGALDYMWGSSGVIESKDILLKWIEEDPVDTWEMGRNDSTEAILGTRNVFVDYPELAFDLFGETDIPKHTTPSGYAASEGAVGGGSTGSGDDTTDDTTTDTVGNCYVKVSSITDLTDDNYLIVHEESNAAFNGALTADAAKNYIPVTISDDKITVTSDTTAAEVTLETISGGHAIKTKSGSYLSQSGTNAKLVYGTSAFAHTISIDGGVAKIVNASNTSYMIMFNTASDQMRFRYYKGTQKDVSLYKLVADSSSGDEEIDQDKIYVDADDVVISGASSAFDESTVVTAVEITSGDSFDTANTALADMAFKKIYDVTATNGGETVQPESPLTITLDIPTGYNVDNTYIVYIDENGVVETLETLEKTETTISAEITHFSTYAVVDTSEVSSGGEGEIVETEATITFDANKTQRVSFSTSQQVWTNDGLTFTNDKASSTSSVADYSNPVRIYAKSSVTLKHTTGTIKSITFAASGSSYVTPLKNSVGTSGTVTTSGNNVTITFDTPVETYTIASVTAQIRLASITATVVTTTSGETPSVTISATVNNTTYGSADVSGNYIIATPATGYEIDSTNPYTIVDGNKNATVTQSDNNFTVETDSDVTVQINFVARTQYTVTFKEMGSTTSTQNAYSGGSITLPTITSDDYTVVGWVAAEIDGETTDKPTVYNAGATYTVTASTTFYALYSRSEAGGSGESDVFAKYTGTITEGDYLIVFDGGAMKASVTSSRLDYTNVTDSSGSITSPDASLIWTVTADGDYYTLYNESTGKYAAGTGAKNKAQLLSSVDDKARWTVSGTATYEFVNKQNAANSVNSNLRRNGTYGFACYATGTGGALTLYKRTEAAMTTYYFTSAGETPDYTVTANANNAEYGTVNVSGTTISAVPNAGYTVSGYSIESGTATVIQENNTFFVTPTSDVVITINFEALPTYTVTFVEGDNTVSTDSTYSGGFIKLPEYSGELDEYTTFDGWAETQNETDAAKIYKANATYAVTKNVTLYAQFTVTEPDVPEESDHYFIKVNEDQTDWTGTYLIVYEDGSKAFNGGLDTLDAAYNNIDVTITDGKIAATDTTLAAVFTIIKSDEKYLIKSASGYYIGSARTSNYLNSSTSTEYLNTISFDDGVSIASQTGTTLQFNTTNNQLRFRYFSTSQKPIALYKLDVADLSGAQVTVGNDLSLNYYVNVTNVENIADDSLYVRFTAEGDTSSTTVELDKSKTEVIDENTYYVFTFEGLAPQRMTDNIKAELLFNGIVIDVLGNYSVKQSALSVLADDPDNSDLNLFVSTLLHYGAAAQNYTKYNTDNLATDGVTGLVEPSGVPDASSAMVLTNNTTPDTVYFRAATVWFDNVNKLIIKLSTATANTKLYVDGVLVDIDYDEESGTYSYTTSALSVTDFSKVFTFTLYENDTLIQTLEYSVNAYAYSKYQSSNNPNMQALALALFRLGQSAENL